MTRKSKTYVFVAMSFDEKYYWMFTLIQAIAGTSGVIAVRADEDKEVIKRIKPGIFGKIKDADLVIAEISSGSPNVLYEIGWAHAMGKSTLLLAEEGASIPFDINDYLVVKYNPKSSQKLLRKQIETEFDKHLTEAKTTINFRQPLVEMLGSVEDVASRDDLFSYLLRLTMEKFSQEAKQWTGDSIHVNSSEAIEKGIKVFEKLRKGGFATYLVPLNNYWETNDEYSKKCRLAASSRNIKINRCFLLQNYDALFSESLRKHVKLDEGAGIQTYITFIDNIPDKESVQDFGIWDEELLCLIEVGLFGGETKVKGCVFSRDIGSIEKAHLWKDSIISVAQPALDLFSSIDGLDDSIKLLLRSADIMRKEANTSCSGSYLTGNKSSCKWYHAAWQYLRILGMVSTPDWHSNFYAKAYSEAFNKGCKDVLISGTADYAIVDHLLNTEDKRYSGDICITVLDVCWTPIEICKWYEKWFIKENNLRPKLRYNKRDALNTGYHEQSFDLITTDAFLTRFNETEREQLLTEWHRILKPGGRVVTTARLSTDLYSKEITAAEKDVSDFVEKALVHIDDKKPWLRSMKDSIECLARNYAENIVSYPVFSEEYIKELFKGFKCTIEIGITPGEFEGATKYARIIALRE